MAKLRYSKRGVAAIASGVVLTAIDVIGAVGYLVSQDQPSCLVAGGAVVTWLDGIKAKRIALVVATIITYSRIASRCPVPGASDSVFC